MKSLLLCGALLVSTIGSSGSVFATEYTDATTAKTDAMISFEKDDAPVDPVDPNDPDKPVEPVDPTNPNGGELMISYASKLDFGTHNKTESTLFAKADEMKDGSKIVPFVSVKDARSADRKGWSLTAKVDGAFTDSSGHTLDGAELKLSNLVSGKGEANDPNIQTGEIILNNTEQEIASADTTNGVGVNSIGFGQLQADETTNGVQLSVPSSVAKNADQYQTTVTYSLVADPTNP